MDWATILVAVITAGFAFLGVYMSNRKQAALVAYRLEKLEAKVDKHNNVVERMYRLESRRSTGRTDWGTLPISGSPPAGAKGRSIPPLPGAAWRKAGSGTKPFPADGTGSGCGTGSAMTMLQPTAKPVLQRRSPG